MQKQATTSPKYSCDLCDYNTSKIYNFNRHIVTEKHIQLENQRLGNTILPEKEQKTSLKYSCRICDYNTSKIYNFKQHNATAKHIQLENQRLGNTILPEKEQKRADISPKYSCILCDYNTSKLSNFKHHNSTAKHISLKNTNNSDSSMQEHLPSQIIQSSYTCEKCNKKYSNRSGLWRHKKICNIIQETQQDNITVCLDEIPDESLENVMIPHIIQQCDQEDTQEETQEDTTNNGKTYITNEMMCEILKEMAITNSQNVELQKQNAEFQEKLLEFMKNNQNSNITNITNNNNGGNTNNVQINMDTFLTRCCKDAPTIHDFLKSIQITLEEMYCMGKEGTKKTVSRILDRVLKDIEITERPFHCTDAKRHVNYIKETEGWLKTQDQEHLINLCNSISRKCGSRYVEFSKTEEHLIKYGPNLSEIGLQIILEANGGKAGWSHNHTISANLLEAKYHINKEDMKDAIQKLT
jgi:hypothetical protein